MKQYSIKSFFFVIYLLTYIFGINKYKYKNGFAQALRLNDLFTNVFWILLLSISYVYLLILDMEGYYLTLSMTMFVTEHLLLFFNVLQPIIAILITIFSKHNHSVIIIYNFNEIDKNLYISDKVHKNSLKNVLLFIFFILTLDTVLTSVDIVTWWVNNNYSQKLLYIGIILTDIEIIQYYADMHLLLVRIKILKTKILKAIQNERNLENATNLDEIKICIRAIRKIKENILLTNSKYISQVISNYKI